MIYPLYCYIHFVVQSEENIYFKMFVIYFNGKTLKTRLLQVLLTTIIFSSKFGGKHFPLYLWVRYEPVWTDFNAQKLILSVNLLVEAQTITKKRQMHDISLT